MTAALPERVWARAHARELAAMIAAYLVVLVGSNLWRDQATGILRVLLTLAPIIPFSALPLVVLRMLARVDERERMLVYRSVTFAFFAAAILTFAYGFVELAGAPRLSMFWVWPVMAACWLVGRLAASRMP